MPRKELHLKTSVVALVSLILLAAGSARAADTGSQTIQFSTTQIQFYQSTIQPILADNCFKCHSHKAEKIKGGLVLDSRAAALKGGDTGPAVVPGAPEKSLLLRAVQQVDEDLKMPPKKKLAQAQIDLLAKWISMGVPFLEAREEAAPAARQVRASTSDTNWWSFQPVKKPTPPKIENGGWSRNPIDKFIFAGLKEHGLAPAPEASKRALIRRAYFDLIGLPPSAEEVGRFVQDSTPDAYEKIVDQLLASPRYGEKWARHWLDLVRFAESDGYKADAFRPNAWRYRDYVIRSFNEDKPFNRFLMEQVAADELWPDEPDSLIGVSYLRLPIYEYNQRNVKAQWATILNDITDVTADAFLGLGLQCARCHDHKFDPILQRDYYRMQAFFAAILPREDLPLATPAQVKEYEEKLAVWQEQAGAVLREIDELETPARERSAKTALDKLPREIQTMLKKPAGERTPYERQICELAYRQLVEEFEKLDGKLKGAEKEKRDALESELSKYSQFAPEPLPDAMLVTDVGPFAPPTVLPKDKTQTPVPPGFLTVLGSEPAKVEPISAIVNSTGRRAALARWLGRPDNQFTTRVMVNRIWQRHFGRGLAAMLNDFGHLGEPPTHPELLDWLATTFVEQGWSVKRMQRLMMTSAAYRQSASVGPNEKALTVDAANRWLWRQNMRRLEAEQIRDAMLAVTGELDLKAGGPSVDASKPRRAVYTKWLRNSRDPLLEAFDPPDAYTSTPERNVTTTPMQSLVMINGPYVFQRAQALASRIQQTEKGVANPETAVRAAYHIAYAREPSMEETQAGVTFLKEQADRISRAGIVARPDAAPMPKRSGTAAQFRPDGAQTRLVVPDNHLMPQYDFTIEATVLLRSVDAGDAPRTIVSRWDGRKDQPGWSLGVAGKGSKATAQTLVLELIGDPAEDGAGGYELIGSRLHLELDTPYYVAVTLRIGDTSETGVAFYARELTAGAEMRSVRAPHKVTANHQSNLPLIIGGRNPERQEFWDGLIDDVRLSDRALKSNELLVARETTDTSTVGFWRFEEPDFFKDSSSNGHNIRSEISPTAQSAPATAALIDFCHVLINSSEFLYTE